MRLFAYILQKEIFFTTQIANSDDFPQQVITSLVP